MKKLPLARRAAADLEHILDYVSAESPEAAIRLSDDILALCRRICANPLAYQSCEELRPGYRRGVCKPYLVFFRIDQRGVRIERILHGARDLPQALKP